MTESKADRERIAAVIEQYRHGFATLDADNLVAIWDRDYEDLVYVALEESAPRRTWKAIEDYYRAALTAEPGFRVVEMQVETLSMGVLADAAHVLCQYRFEGEQDGNPEPVIAEGRATFVLRRHRTAWKVVHYHETALGPCPS